MIFILILVGLCLYTAVRGVFVWAERQPYEEELWPVRGEGGPACRCGAKKGTTDA